MRFASAVVLILASALASSSMAEGPKKPIPVKLEKTGTGYRLLRDGQPFFIKGRAGGLTSTS